MDCVSYYEKHKEDKKVEIKDFKSSLTIKVLGVKTGDTTPLPTAKDKTSNHSHEMPILIQTFKISELKRKI